MKTTPHRFRATGVRVVEAYVHQLDPAHPGLRVDYALLDDNGATLGRVSYQGANGWSPEVDAAYKQLQEALENFAINAFFDVPLPASPSSSSLQPPVDSQELPEQF